MRIGTKPQEEKVIKIDITGRRNTPKDKEQSRKDDLEKIEKERQSKLN